MASANLQTIIVSKRIAKTCKAAEKHARKHTGSIYTVRETGSSWRFRQRPPSDFVAKSFRSFPIPESPEVVLVYGKLKRNKNPGDQTFLQFRSGKDLDSDLREWDYWMNLVIRLENLTSVRKLIEIAHEVENRGLQSATIRYQAIGKLADKARILRLSRTKKSPETDMWLYQDMIRRKLNPTKAKKQTKKKANKQKIEVLKKPNRMPDPGPCSWLGSIVELGWEMKNGDSSKKIDDKGNAVWSPGSEWMFLWSPKFKAVVAIQRPKEMYETAEICRYGNAAKMFEAFMARPADNTFEIDVPNVALEKVGERASHIVYRSDKWSNDKTNDDYIHDFRKICDADGCRSKSINLYCGPSIKNPKVFLCFGGKLTLTERGLVW